MLAPTSGAVLRSSIVERLTLANAARKAQSDARTATKEARAEGEGRGRVADPDVTNEARDAARSVA
mgnify:CR=1 FL=1